MKNQNIKQLTRNTFGMFHRVTAFGAIAVFATTFLFTQLGAVGLALAEDKAPWKIPSFKAKQANPVPSTPSSIKQGKATYTQLCGVCHGASGKGDGPAAVALDPRPADLGRPEMGQQTDGELFWKISEGRAPMPPFEAVIPKENRWHLVNYLRTFSADSKKNTSNPQHDNKSFNSSLGSKQNMTATAVKDQHNSTK